MKKFFALFLAALMIASVCSLSAFAADPSDLEANGTITINGASADATYEVYKLLYLESYNVDTGAYSYKVNENWVNFFAEGTGALDYVAIDAQGYVTWINGDDDASIAAFAKLALAYAQANGIAPVKSSKNAGEFTVDGSIGKFTNLELGWYLVDSSVGALCGLTTTNPNAVINAKNGVPSIDKQVKEDSTEQWGASSTADIGQTVNFRVTISVHDGAQNFVLHDDMSDGITFKGVTDIQYIDPSDSSKNRALVEGTDYYVLTKTGITEATDDDIPADAHDAAEDWDCTFEVHFADEFIKSLDVNDKIVVHYDGMLNRNAIVASANINEAKLEYGDHHYTTEDKTETFTFGFDLIKTDASNKLLEGATFKIYDAATGGNEVAVVLMDDGVTYRRARADETGVKIEMNGGKARLVGFDNGTYFLEEIDVPDGFNKLANRHKFIIADANLDAIFLDGVYSIGSGVQVVNKSGSVLPETGGFGTMMFVLVGGLMVAATGVILVSRKRMSKLGD